MKKINVCVIFGGKSSEYEVSLRSATTVIDAIEEFNKTKEKYNIIKLGISKKGEWFLYSGKTSRIADDSWINDSEKLKKAFISPDTERKGIIVLSKDGYKMKSVDVFFPVLHGKLGEDGTIQGLMELSTIPYVGCNVLSSAVCMNKVYANLTFDHFGINQASWQWFLARELNDLNVTCDKIESQFSYPCVIKPANAGSSVGVTIAKDRTQLKDGLVLAAEHDDYILIEEFIDGREVECAILGNENPKSTIIGEIISPQKFYDYEEKYKTDTTTLIAPADLDQSISDDIRQTAIKAYKALSCSGLSRIDFFVRNSDNAILLNEINTLPGFTTISMYPRLWRKMGLETPALVDTLIELAINK